VAGTGRCFEDRQNGCTELTPQHDNDGNKTSLTYTLAGSSWLAWSDVIGSDSRVVTDYGPRRWFGRLPGQVLRSLGQVPPRLGDWCGGISGEISSTRSSKVVATLALTGELDMVSAPRPGEFGDLALTEIVSTLRIDLAGVTFIDSTGLGALIAIKNMADHVATGTDIGAPVRARRSPLEITRLTQHFQIDKPS